MTRIDVAHDSDTFRSVALVDIRINGGRTEDRSRTAAATNTPILVENIQDVQRGSDSRLLLGGLFAQNRQGIARESIRIVARRDAGLLRGDRRDDGKPAKSISARRNGHCGDAVRRSTGRKTSTRETAAREIRYFQVHQRSRRTRSSRHAIQANSKASEKDGE